MIVKKNIHNLYNAQNDILKLIFKESSIFTLSGGTSLNRFFYKVRASEDLDLFTQDKRMFSSEVKNLENLISDNNFNIVVDKEGPNFSRFFAKYNDEEYLKIEMIKDVEFGSKFRDEIIFNINNSKIYVDHPLEILSNKIGAIHDREESKDVCDLLTISLMERFNWAEIIEHAETKQHIDREYLEMKLKTFPKELMAKIIFYNHHVGNTFFNRSKEMLEIIIHDIIAKSDNTLIDHYNYFFENIDKNSIIINIDRELDKEKLEKKSWFRFSKDGEIIETESIEIQIIG